MLYCVFDSWVFGSVSKQLSNCKCVFFFLLKKKNKTFCSRKREETRKHTYIYGILSYNFSKLGREEGIKERNN